MKILFFRHSLLNRGGDKMIALHASHLARCGHHVVIMTNVVNTVFSLDEKVKIVPLKFKGKLGTLFSAVLQKCDADLVIADIIPMTCFLSLRFWRKVVYFAQDYDESYYDSPLLKSLIRLFYCIGLSLCRIPAITVSHQLAGLLLKRFKAKLFVAENGVDTNVFYPDPDLELIAAKSNRNAVLLLSRNDQRKGFDLARAVIDHLSKSHANMFEVWTVGEKCSGVFDGLVHRDFAYVGEEKLRQIMSSADVFLYPTRHEGFGLMPLEAFACRCPVVTTEAVSYVRDGFNALVSPVGDVASLAVKVGLLLGDCNLAERLSAEGLTFSAEHSLCNSLETFESCIVNLVPVSERC